MHLCGTKCGQTPGNEKEKGKAVCREEVSEKGSVTYNMKVKCAIVEREDLEGQQGPGRSGSER